MEDINLFNIYRIREIEKKSNTTILLPTFLKIYIKKYFLENNQNFSLTTIIDYFIFSLQDKPLFNITQENNTSPEYILFNSKEQFQLYQTNIYNLFSTIIENHYDKQTYDSTKFLNDLLNSIYSLDLYSKQKILKGEFTCNNTFTMSTALRSSFGTNNDLISYSISHNKTTNNSYDTTSISFVFTNNKESLKKWLSTFDCSTQSCTEGLTQSCTEGRTQSCTESTKNIFDIQKFIFFTKLCKKIYNYKTLTILQIIKIYNSLLSNNLITFKENLNNSIIKLLQKNL